VCVDFVPADRTMAASRVSTGERLCSYRAAPLFSLSLIICAPELRMRVYVNCRQSDFKPDPVCAFDSARKDFAVECGYVMRWYVVFVVDDFVDA